MINRYINRKHLLSLSLFYFLFLALQISCKKDDEEIVITNPKTEVSFEYQSINNDDDSFYKVKSSDVLKRSSEWYRFTESQNVKMSKSIHFTTESEAGIIKSIEIRQEGGESNAELLVLEDEEKAYGRNWNYKSTDTEIQNFWKRPFRSLIINGDSYFIPSAFEVVSARKALVDGVEKTYLEIRFSGETTAMYATPGVTLRIKNGSFKGVLE